MYYYNDCIFFQVEKAWKLLQERLKESAQVTSKM